VRNDFKNELPAWKNVRKLLSQLRDRLAIPPEAAQIESDEIPDAC